MRIWDKRYRRWLDAVLAADIDATQVLLVDDGSPVLPGWPDTPVYSGDTLADAAPIVGRTGPVLFHFTEHLGRPDTLNFPGWHRSFAFAVAYAEKAGFDRVIHLESDAFLVSPRMRAYVRARTSGWTAMWCEKYHFPEIAVQIIGTDKLPALLSFTQAPYAGMIGKLPEFALRPHTEVERDMVGDRYGETDKDVPRTADFASQVPCQREPGYYWWLQPPPQPTPPRVEGRIDFTFGRSGNVDGRTLKGWAEPEATQQWMVSVASVFALPPLAPDANYDLVAGVIPYLATQQLKLQRLILQVNHTVVAEFDLHEAQHIGCALPAASLRRDDTDRLRFLHPDALSPNSVGDGDDGRMLALALRWLSLVPR
jgi:hypothetical protein